MTERERLIKLLQVISVDATNPRMLEMTAVNIIYGHLS